MRPILTTLALATLATVTSAQVGYLVDTSSDELFIVDCTTGAATLLASVANNGLVTAADLSYRLVTDELWTVDLGGGELGTIDPGTGTFSPIYQTNLNGWQGLAWDETTQLFFLANQSDDLYSFDPATSTLTLIGNTGAGLITCLDTDVSGTLYGMDFSSGAVVILDKTTGARTTVSTALNGIQGLGIDWATGSFFGSNTGDDSLHLIDAATGSNTLIGAHGAGITFAKGFDLIDGFSGSVPAVNTNYGTGCSGLSLDGITRPLLGSNWDMGLSGIPAAAIVGVLTMDVASIIVDLTPLGAPGCSVYNSAPASVVLLLPIGTPAFQFPIPNNPTFLSLDLFAQIALLAPGANSLGIVTSNGLQGTVGDF